MLPQIYPYRLHLEIMSVILDLPHSASSRQKGSSPKTLPNQRHLAVYAILSFLVPYIGSKQWQSGQGSLCLFHNNSSDRSWCAETGMDMIGVTNIDYSRCSLAFLRRMRKMWEFGGRIKMGQGQLPTKFITYRFIFSFPFAFVFIGEALMWCFRGAEEALDPGVCQRQ